MDQLSRSPLEALHCFFPIITGIVTYPRGRFTSQHPLTLESVPGNLDERRRSLRMPRHIIT